MGARRRAWGLPVHSGSSVAISIFDTPTAAPRDWECREVFKDADGQAILALREFGGAEERTLPVSGYRGVRSHLPPRAVEESATRPSQRIHRFQCTDHQWALLQRHFHKFKHAGRERRALPSNRIKWKPDQVPTGNRQQSLHVYGQYV